MRSSASINLLNQFLVYKSHSLGKGATGEVFLGKSIKDKLDVAVKVIDIKSIDNEVTQYLLNMEKTALMTVCNPHVLRGLKVIQNQQFCYLITELCNGGSLKSIIKSGGPMSEEKSLKILIEILKGECSLIGKGVVHRDLKPANILLHNGQVKIIDFGYCQIKGHKKPNLDYNVGSPSYMSPEAFLDNDYSQKSQIWAIGVTFYECLNGKTFDQGKNMSEIYKQIRKHGIPYKVQVSQKCKTIISWCLEHDPRKRPTCIQLFDFIVKKPNDDQTPRQSAQSVRVSFTPIVNIDFKTSKLIEKRASFKDKGDTLFSCDGLKNEDLLKTTLGESKSRPIFSSYEPKKLLPPRQPSTDKKTSPFITLRSKYQKRGYEGKPLAFRQKSQLYQPQNVPAYYMTSRQKSKQIPVNMNPARTKIYSKPVDGYPIRQINSDYFGLLTDR